MTCNQTQIRAISDLMSIIPNLPWHSR